MVVSMKNDVFRKVTPTQSPSGSSTGIYLSVSAECRPRHNIKYVGLAYMKLFSLLRLVKYNLGLRTLSVYRILCESGNV
jgi:hypothetical protein